MTNLRQCDQKQCSFNEVKGGIMFCPECDSCGAESNIIDEDCVNCWNCLKDIGYVRSGLPKTIKEKIRELEKKQENLEKEIIVMNKK